VDAFMCYKQKCKVVSLNLAHPVHIDPILITYNMFTNGRIYSYRHRTVHRRRL